MSLYSIFQKFRHKRKAKGRHGVHSPFVYDFIEQIINGRHSTADCTAFGHKHLSLTNRQKRMITAIFDYYKCSEILVDPGDTYIKTHPEESILYLFTDTGKLAFIPDEQDIVLIPGIHRDADHKQQWNTLSSLTVVSLSLDIFELGVLFFKKEFLIKQHFLLKSS